MLQSIFFISKQHSYFFHSPPPLFLSPILSPFLKPIAADKYRYIHWYTLTYKEMWRCVSRGLRIPSRRSTAGGFLSQRFFASESVLSYESLYVLLRFWISRKLGFLFGTEMDLRDKRFHIMQLYFRFLNWFMYCSVFCFWSVVSHLVFCFVVERLLIF